MKRLVFLFFTIVLSTTTWAQVGIGTTSPDSSAALDINDADGGMLIPRVSLSDVTDGTSPINSPATSLLVYNTNALVAGGNGVGFYYWSGSSWEQLVTSANPKWELGGNTGTNPTNDYIGTADTQDLVFGTNDTEQMRITSAGNIGVGVNNPTNKLEVQGSVLMDGDFINQQILGIHSGTVQAIPFTNGVMTPLTNTTVSITVTDGSGVNNSAVFVSGFARVFGGSLVGNISSLGGYFMVLQRDTDPAFSAPVNLTYTAGSCFISTPNGVTAAVIGFGDGGHISYLDDALTAGTTYYYRLALFTNGVSITGGTYDVYQRDLNVLQIKQ